MTQYITDGTKAIPLGALRPDAWTPEDATDAERAGGFSKAKAARGVPVLYRAVDIRAKAVAGMPYRLERHGQNVTENDELQPLRASLRRHLYLTEASLCFKGGAYFELGTNRMGRNLTPFFLAPQTVAEVIDPAQGLTGFTRNNGAGVKTLQPDKVLYTWLPSADTEIGPGAPPVGVVLEDAGVLYSLSRYTSAFFTRGGIKMTLLSVPKSAPQKEKDRLKAWWDSMFRGVRSAFSSIILNEEIKPTVIGSDPKDTAAPELIKISNDAVAAGMGVPLSLIFSNPLAGGTVVAERLNFYDFTIVPECYTIEEPLNAQYLDRIGLRLIFDPEQLEVYQAAALAKAQGITELVGEPILLVDEGRQMMGREPRGIAEQQLKIAVDERRAELDLPEPEPEPDPNTPPGGGGMVDPGTLPPAEVPEDEPAAPAAAPVKATERTMDLARWEAKALKAQREGRGALVRFTPDVLAEDDAAYIREQLAGATDRHAIKAVFDAVKAAPGEDLTPRERMLYDRLRRVLAKYGDDVTAQIVAGGAPSLDGLEPALRAALLGDLTAVALEVMGDVSAAIGPDFDPARMASAAGDWARGYTYELVKGITDTSRSALQRTVAMFSETPGLGSAGVARLLAPIFGERRADVIAVTEIGRAAAAAQQMYGQYLREHGIEVEHVYQTVNEDRVCPICAPRNGTVVEPAEFPPLHPRCRCFVTTRVKRTTKSAPEGAPGHPFEDDAWDDSEIDTWDDESIKHMPGAHDQRSHGRSGARRTASRATYSAARAGGASVAEARARAKEVSTTIAEQQRIANINKQLQGHTSASQRESLRAERERLQGQVQKRLDRMPLDDANTVRDASISPTVSGRQAPKPAAPAPAPAAKPKRTRAPKSADKAAKVAQQVRDAEDKIRAQRFETAYAVDPKGKVLLYKDGGKDYVDISDAEFNRIKGTGALFTHNHPSGWDFPPGNPRHAGTSFSPEDVSMAARLELAEMRAVGPGRRYSIKPPPGGWNERYYYDTMVPVIAKHEVAVRKDFTADLQSGRMTIDQANALHYHTVWSRVSAELGIPYSYTED